MNLYHLPAAIKSCLKPLKNLLLLWCLGTVLFTGTAPASAGPLDGDKTQLPLPFTDTCELSFVHNYLKPGQYLPVSAVKPGMQGYGLTVFQGTAPQKFQVKVIGVIKKMLNGRDAILVKLSGGPLAGSNVIRGMSGSPVYINNKLVGAISFGYYFSKEPIAGITPIVDMLDALDSEHHRTGRIAGVNNRSWIESKGDTSTVSGSTGGIMPLLSPLALVGFSPRAEAFLAKRFQPSGLSVSSGGSGAPDTRLTALNNPSLQPGSAVSVLLSTGDFNSVATGTVTARFGNNIIAFGHPFLQAGAVDFPLATAYIHQILPSLYASFKVSSPVKVVGSLLSDRPWSIGGRLGSTSKMIPCRFTVVDKTRGIKRNFNCQVVDHPDLTPELLAATTISAIDTTHQTSGPYVASVETNLEAAGIEPIHRFDRFSSNLTPSSLSDSSNQERFMSEPIGNFVLHLASDLTSNEFEPCSIKQLQMHITLEDGHETAVIDKVYLDKAYVEPGENLTVNCRLKPYNKEALTEALTITIPRDAPDGQLLIGVAPGDSLPKLQKRLQLNDPQAESLPQIAQQINRRGRGDALTVLLALPQQSIIFNGQKLHNPPAHWSKVFLSNRQTKAPHLVNAEIRLSRPTNWLLEGSHLLTVEVRSSDKAAARLKPYTLSGKSTEDGIITTEQAQTLSRPSKSSSATFEDPASTKSVSDKPKPIPTLPYPHMRPLSTWKLDSQESLLKGKTIDTTIDSRGHLSAGFKSLPLKPFSGDGQIWSCTWNNDAFWFSSLNQIWRLSTNGNTPEQVTKLPGLMVSALTSDAQGTIYAATSAPGTVWSLSCSGKPSQIYKAQESIITSLCVDPQNNLYIGCAGSGKVYKLNPEKHSSTFWDSGQTHITCLFFCRHDGQLYAGTAEKGCVYKLDSRGQATAVYQSSDRIITGIAVNKQQDLYVSTAFQGNLVKVSASRQKEVIATSEAFYTLYYDPRHDYIFSGQATGEVAWIKEDPLTQKSYFVPVCRTDQEAVLALAADSNDNLFIGTSNLSGLHLLQMTYSNQAAYESPVYDAQKPADWLLLKLTTSVPPNAFPPGAGFQVSCRSGNTSQPDESWSKWQSCPTSGQGFQLNCPSGRFLQYKIRWPDTALSDNRTTKSVSHLEVSYRAQNSAPEITHSSLNPAAVLSGKFKVSASGCDPDNDNMLLSIDISSDAGHSWQNLAADLRAGKPEPQTRQTKKKKGQVADESIPDSPEASNQTTPEEIPASKSNLGSQDKLSTDSKSSGQAMSKPAHKKLSGKKNSTSTVSLANAGNQPPDLSTDSTTSESFSYSWDTGKLKDGPYLVRLTLDDRLSNNRESQQAIALYPVSIHNSKPEIAFIDSQRHSDNTLEFNVGIKSKAETIVNATYKIDDGEPFTLAAPTGTGPEFNQLLKSSVIKVTSGSHKVEIKLTDIAGNTISKSFTIK